MEKNKQHIAGERTAFALEELSDRFNGSIIRQKSYDMSFHHSILDSHFRTGITCHSCFIEYLWHEHGLYGRDTDEYTKRFTDWFIMPKSTMFVVLGFSDISEHRYQCRESGTIRNDFSMNLMVIGHEKVKAYNGFRDWKKTNPIEPPQFVRFGFGTKRRNVNANNKNLFTKIFEVIEAP